MEEVTILWVVGVAAVVAGVCAVTCIIIVAWLARSTAPRSGQPTPGGSPAPGRVLVERGYPSPVPMQPVAAVPVTYVQVLPAPMQPQRSVVRQLPVTGQHPTPARHPVILEGRYPGLGGALGTWMQVEPDELERMRIAQDLGTLGDASSARALLDGVRSGVLSPTAAADYLQQGGFEAGIVVAAALQDPEPRVRAIANSLVGRTTPLVRTTLQPPPGRDEGHA